MTEKYKCFECGDELVRCNLSDWDEDIYEAWCPTHGELTIHKEDLFELRILD